MTLILTYCYIIILLFVGLWPFNFWQANKATLDEQNGLYLAQPGTIYTKAPPKKLSQLEEFTILLSLSSDYYDSNGYGRILTYSNDCDEMNFMIGQWEDAFVFRLNADYKEKPVHFETEGILKKGKDTWIAIVYDKEHLLLYQDGVKKHEKKVGFLRFSTWDDTYPLAIGCEADGTYCWKGKIYRVSIFNRAFTGEDLRSLPLSVKEKLPLISYNFREVSDHRIIKDQGMGVPADLTVHKYFKPYRRMVLNMLRFDPKTFSYYMMDIFINLIGFIPLGFLLSAYLNRKTLFVKNTLIMSFLTGFGVSIIIELLQVFLPSRNSDLIDLTANTFGSVIGAFMFIMMYQHDTGDRLSITKERNAKTDVNVPYNLTMKKTSNRIITNIENRHTLFLFFTIIAIAMFYSPLRALLRTYTETDSYLHIILIPLISGYLIYEKRGMFSPDFSYSWKTGIPLLMIGLTLFAFFRTQSVHLNKNDYASLITFSAAIFWIGALLLSYGNRVLQTALFPLIFLIFMIPIPTVLMNRFIDMLQTGSVFVTDAMFRIMGIAFTRDGLVFHLTGISIKIAPQCSGINSSIALLIIGILAAHLFVNTNWKRLLLIVCIFPIAIIKNGIRIVALSLLGAHVDKNILTHGFFHQSGGFIFYIPALMLILMIAWLLRISEKKNLKAVIH